MNPTRIENQFIPEKTESLKIKQDNIEYSLLLTVSGDIVLLTLSETEDLFFTNYSRKLTLNEIKQYHYILLGINSCSEFLSYLKSLSEGKNIIIQKNVNEEKIYINLMIEYLFKKDKVQIELFKNKLNLDSIVHKLSKEIINLKNENNNLKNEINEIKNILKPINKKYQEEKRKYNISTIMKENELNLINNAIKDRLNKEIKELKKIYQASIDGDGALNFHSKCDGIPNTLVLIQSAGNKRFGGFTTRTWESIYESKDDKNAFLFSLDKQKIYPYKNDGKAISCYKDSGPCFGYGFTIFLGNNVIQEKKLYTRESYSECSYNFYGDNNALSEDGKGCFINAKDYEVFQVIFS